MRKRTKEVESYLLETLRIKATVKDWKDSKLLPLFLQTGYHFQQVNLLELPFLLLVDQSESGQSPATIRKHMERLGEYWKGGVIYVPQKTSAKNRQRLVEKQIAFLVPGTQLYLPPLGIDFRESFSSIRVARSHFSASTQAIIINTMVSKTTERYTPKSLASKLQYSIMEMTRAFAELEDLKIGHSVQDGRERVLVLPDDKRLLWERAGRYMRNPVSKRIFVESVNIGPHALESGVTALSHYTMLTAPKRATYATSRKAYRTNLRHKEQVKDQISERAFELEIWHYDPNLFAEMGRVDRFSLYLSLRDEKDERIEIALKEMMERFEWFQE